jgi:uncharacterized protein YcbX
MSERPERIDGRVVGLWRYPVKSMMGEELNAADIGVRGLGGDRVYALVDDSDGKVASAKNPRKWPRMFECRAALADAPDAGTSISAVRITLPDGTVVKSEQADIDAVISTAMGRKVTLIAGGNRNAGAAREASAEEYWPDMEGLDYRDTVTEFSLPEGTFFDAASVHLLTTATLERLRELYPRGRFEVRRFRPNIVVAMADGASGFVENDWVGHTVAIGDEVRLSVTGPCPRCVMTTLTQGDLPRDPGILRTAAQGNHVNVGVYASVLQGGKVRRGDSITVA